MSNTYNALIHAKQDGMGEEVANNLSGGGGSDLSDYAKQEELSNLVLTGTTNTSGATIAAGTCFVLNGDFVTAKADIASGATFTLNTNYEKKSVGSILTELNSKNKYMKITIPWGSVTVDTAVVYDVTENYPQITGNNLKGVSLTIVGGNIKFDMDGVVNFYINPSNAHVVIIYNPKATQTNCSSYAYVQHIN